MTENATPKVRVDRKAVYAAIDTERDYQRKKWGEPSHSIDEFALYIIEYTAKLQRIAGTTNYEATKLDAVRKVAALAVACLEQHGAPPRV